MQHACAWDQPGNNAIGPRNSYFHFSILCISIEFRFTPIKKSIQTSESFPLEFSDTVVCTRLELQPL